MVLINQRRHEVEATKILMEEHRVIERAIAAIEVAARRLDSDPSIRAGFFLDAADFIREFADGSHHRKEEGVLFPAMEVAGVPRKGGPIGVMLAEHEEGRRLTRRMRAAAEKLAAGDEAARDEVQRNALGYVNLLRQHILKEDSVLFPMADRVIQGQERAEVADAFERIQQEETAEGVHEKYLGVAESLEREVQG
jgi:hemerythrin-like domain-containing protein